MKAASVLTVHVHVYLTGGTDVIQHLYSAEGQDIFQELLDLVVYITLFRFSVVTYWLLVCYSTRLSEYINLIGCQNILLLFC